MIMRLQKFIFGAIACYLGLYCVSIQFANFMLCLFLILLVPILILRWVFINRLYKRSINTVSNNFRLRDNALHNDFCTILYTPDEKIVVMDNNPTANHAKRMFTLTKHKLDINKAWNRLCRIFDAYVTLDSLHSFYSYDTNVEVLTLETRASISVPKKEMKIDTTNNGPKFVDMNEVQPDSFGKSTNKVDTNNQNFVDMGSLPDSEKFETTNNTSSELMNMKDIMVNSSTKIDVNVATASELSVLPGINIVLAKKIVEHRNINGFFKNDEEFLKVANVKPHFAPKIKQNIIVSIPKQKDDDDHFEGRIVDF